MVLLSVINTFDSNLNLNNIFGQLERIFLRMCFDKVAHNNSRMELTGVYDYKNINLKSKEEWI